MCECALRCLENYFLGGFACRLPAVHCSAEESTSVILVPLRLLYCVSYVCYCRSFACAIYIHIYEVAAISVVCLSY